MTFGELINKLLEWLSEFWPIRIISEWEQGVLVRAGKVVGRRTHQTGLWGTGFHLIVPFLYELIVQDSNIDAEITPRLDATTADDITVSLRAAVQYEIVNMATMWKSIHDYEDSVMTAICAAVVEVVLQLDYDDLVAGLPEDALVLCNEVLEPWGVHVRHIGIASLTKTQTLRLIGDSE
jgi:regulator of protease activity HflC (stomatin/prohibitin superfamily)